MGRVAHKLGSRLYPFENRFDVSRNAQDIALYFCAGIANFAGLGNRPLTLFPPTNNSGVQEAISGAGEILYEYGFEQSGYLIKMLIDLVGQQTSAIGTPTVTVRAFLRFADQRGDQPLLASTAISPGSMAVSASGRTTFPPVSVNQLVPAGTRLIVGITVTDTAGTYNLSAAGNLVGASIITLKIASIPDTGLIYAQSSRIA